MTEGINTNYLGVTPGIANYIIQEVGDVDLSEYYTKSEINSKLDSIGAGGEVVLNNYYTKSESDNKYALKTDIGTVDLSNCLTSNSTDFILLNTCRIRTENQLQFRTGRFIISSNGYGNINCTEALSMNGMSKINFGSNGVIGFRTPYRLYDIITESNYVTEKDLETLVPSTDLSGYYTKNESDSKFALKSESGNVDLSKCLTTDSTKFDLTICTINGKNKMAKTN